jgi:hypothetical protein
MIVARSDNGYTGGMKEFLSEEQRRQLASWLARQRKRASGRCAVCGTEFEGRIGKRYCSQVCNQRAYRERLRGEQS